MNFVFVRLEGKGRDQQKRDTVSNFKLEIFLRDRKRHIARSVSCPWHVMSEGRATTVLVLPGGGGRGVGRGTPVLIQSGGTPELVVSWSTPVLVLSWDWEGEGIPLFWFCLGEGERRGYACAGLERVPTNPLLGKDQGPETGVPTPHPCHVWGTGYHCPRPALGGVGRGYPCPGPVWGYPWTGCVLEYPCTGSVLGLGGGGGTPVLVLSGGRGEEGVRLCWSWLGYPQTPLLGKDQGPETGVPPPRMNQGQETGVPRPPCWQTHTCENSTFPSYVRGR